MRETAHVVMTGEPDALDIALVPLGLAALIVMARFS